MATKQNSTKNAPAPGHPVGTCPPPQDKNGKVQYFWMQLTNREDQPNDFIGPFTCVPGLRAHQMVYGPNWAYIVMLDKLPEVSRVMEPGEHKRVLYAMKAQEAKNAELAASGQQPEIAQSWGEGDITGVAESADVPDSPDPADTAE